MERLRHGWLVVWVWLLMLAACTPTPAPTGLAVRLARYTVRIQVACPDGQVHNGSGVLISPEGHIATAYHLVRPAETTAGCEIRVGTGARLHEGAVLAYRADLVARDVAMDLAILIISEDLAGRPPAQTFPAATLAPMTPEVGETIYILGFPALTDGLLAYDADRVISVGSCESADSCWLLTEAFASWGSSGGPAFNDAGALVGIVLGQRVSVLRGIEQRLTSVRPVAPLRTLVTSLPTMTSSTTQAPSTPVLSLQVDAWQVEVVGPLGVNWRTEPSTAGGNETVQAVLPPGTVLHVVPPGRWEGWWATVDNRGRLGWVKERTERTVLVRPYMTRLTSRLSPNAQAVVSCLTQAPCARLVYSPGYRGEDAVVAFLPGGTAVSLVEPPVWVEGLLWWHVRVGTTEGWLPEVTAEGYRLLAPLPSLPPPSRK